MSRRGVRDDKAVPAMRGKGVIAERTACDGCGAVYLRKTWRANRGITGEALLRARWGRCPACEQVEAGFYQGRVLMRGGFVRDHEAELRRRIDSVARRAFHTQPERRVTSIEHDGEGLEVLTTSQKLAHRIAHELEKAFGGRASYRWSSSDGSLCATWRRGR